MEVATAVAAALNFFPRGQRLQRSRGDLEMALTTDTVAHNSHGFFASHAEALEILQDMDGDFCSRGFDLGHAPNGVCVGLQFELLQLEQSFDNFRHWNSFLQELCREQATSGKSFVLNSFGIIEEVRWLRKISKDSLLCILCTAYPTPVQ